MIFGNLSQSLGNKVPGYLPNIEGIFEIMHPQSRSQDMSNVGWVSKETGETLSGDIVDREKIARGPSIAPDEQRRDETVPHGRGQMHGM